jgi:hypothetical protein
MRHGIDKFEMPVDGSLLLLVKKLFRRIKFLHLSLRNSWPGPSYLALSGVACCVLRDSRLYPTGLGESIDPCKQGSAVIFHLILHPSGCKMQPQIKWESS